MKKIINLAVPITILGMILTISSVNASSVDNCIKLEIRADLELKTKEDNDNFIRFKGEITELDTVEFEGIRYTSILVQQGTDNPIDGMIFKVTDSTSLFSDETQSPVEISKLKKGLTVTGYYHENTPMTMSIPGQLQPDILILNENNNTLNKLDNFDLNYLNLAKDFKLNISDGIEIVNERNEKIDNSGLKDSNNFLVFYETTTRSIPAQTTPSKLVLIEERESEIKDKEVTNTPPFTDIKEGYWAKDSIESLYSKGHIEGFPDNTFKPTHLMSRREFMFILGNIINEVDSVSVRPNEASVKMLNVDDGWGYEQVNNVLSRLQIGTTSKLTFDNLDDLNKGITRKEAAYLIDNVIKFSNQPKDTSFTDVGIRTNDEVFESISFANNILNVSGQGVFVGFGDGTFKPNRKMSRAEVAVALNRLLR